MQKVNKTIYKVDSSITQKDLEELAGGVERVNKKIVKEIESMANSPEWERALKELHKKYK